MLVDLQLASRNTRETRWPRKCEACSAREKGKCDHCHRIQVSRMCMYQGETNPMTLSDGTKLDREFWIEAAGYALRELRRGGQ